MKKISFILSFLIVLNLVGCTQSENSLEVKTSNEITYDGKDYYLVSDGIFKGINSVGIRNFDEILNNTTESLQNVYLEYRLPVNLTLLKDGTCCYYSLCDNYIVMFDKSEHYMFSRCWLYASDDIYMPDLVAENIESIEECMGVPEYSYSGDNAESLRDSLISNKDICPIFKNIIKDENDIKSFLEGYLSLGNVEKFQNEVILKHKDDYNSLVAEYNTIRAKVYYKITFNNATFPFKLIIY